MNTLQPGERIRATGGRFKGLTVTVKSVTPKGVLCAVEIFGRTLEELIQPRHLGVFEPPPSLPEPPVLQEKLLALRGAAAREGIELNPPSTEEQLASFEARLGLPLPGSFRALYQTFNGCRYDPEQFSRSPFAHGASLVPLDDILSLHAMWNRLEAETFSKEFRPGEYWNAGWIPFLEMESWGLGVIDTAGCFGGLPGQIIQFNYKDGAERGLTNASFDAWLLTVLAKLERGLLFREHHRMTPEENHALAELVERLNPDFSRNIVLERIAPSPPRR